MRKRELCKKEAKNYFETAHKHKNDPGKAKIFLYKKQICEATMKSIEDKCLLV